MPCDGVCVASKCNETKFGIIFSLRIMNTETVYYLRIYTREICVSRT